MEKDLKNSIDYLNKKTGKNAGFSVSKNYFSEVEESIFAEVSISSLSKNAGFRTPDNYFDVLESNILNSVIADKKQSKVIHFKKSLLKIAPYFAAASIVVFITLNTFISTKTSSFSLESISKNDIENWMEFNAFTNTEIAIALGDDFLNLNDFSFADLKTETLEDYITTIDTEELLNNIE